MYTDIFNAVNNYVLGLIFKQNVLSFPVCLLAVRAAAVETMVVPSRRNFDFVGIRNTDNDTVGPIVVLHRTARIELNNALLRFNIDNGRYLLVVNIFFIRKAYAAARGNKLFIKQIAACRAVYNNADFLGGSIAERVGNAVNHFLRASRHGIVIPARHSVGNVFRAYHFHFYLCRNIAVEIVNRRCRRKRYLFPYVYSDVFFGRKRQFGRSVIAYSYVQLKRFVTEIVYVVVCRIQQGIFPYFRRRIAAFRDFRLCAIRRNDIRFHFLCALYRSGRNCNRFRRCIHACRRKVNAYGRRQNICAEFRFVFIINDEPFQSHMVVVMGLAAAVRIHREPTRTSGFLPKLGKDFLRKRTLCNRFSYLCLENEICIFCASGRLVNPTVQTDCRISCRRVFTDVLPL